MACIHQNARSLNLLQRHTQAQQFTNCCRLGNAASSWLPAAAPKPWVTGVLRAAILPYCLQSTVNLPRLLADNMSSQQTTPPEAANTTTAADEINRFARYFKFRTRGLRETVSNFIGTNFEDDTIVHREEEDDEGFFVDVGAPEEDWVGVTDYATEVPDVRTHILARHTPQAQTALLTIQLQDASQQRYRLAPPPPPGPIQQSSIATQKAALQALGLTSNYLELGLRIVAEDVGWLTHTATFEDAVQKIHRRFPMVTRLSESYGKGAKREDDRRRSNSGAGSAQTATAIDRESGSGSVASSSRRLTEEEIGRFGALEEVPLDNKEADEWGSFSSDA